MTTKDRLKEFLSSQKIGRNKFEEQINISTGYMSSKAITITSDVIEKTVSAYPDLNIEWLITGKGSMLKSESSSQKTQPVSQANSSVIMIPFEEYKKSIAEKDEIIKDQAHKIGMLEHELQLFTSKKQTALGTENAFTAADQQRNIPEAE